MQEETPSIIRNKELPKTMDYQWLRKEAITMTQQMSGDNWTDYNIHDPGVTVLEQFCYALTDIAYRTNLDIETLLFHEGKQEETTQNNTLFPAEEVFPPSSVTLEDYRVLILDEFPNKVANCWVNQIKYHKEGFQGLFEIEIIPKNDISPNEYDEIKHAISALFDKNRNLGEDLENIRILEPEKISFGVEIEIFQDQIAQDVLAEVFFELENYFNPPVKFATLNELEAEGEGLEDIFNIASHKHGFIEKEQLDVQRKEYYVSKIADCILSIKGVRNLRDLNVVKDDIPIYGDIISVSENRYLTMGLLKPEEDAPFKGFDISVYKGGVINKYHEESVLYALNIIENKTHRSYQVLTNPKRSRQSIPKTAELISYESIQKSFPGIYRVGDYEPTQEEGKQRKAQSEQLKSYLLFFDQVMANHLKQLAGIAKLFSIAEADQESSKTYFSQNLVTLGSEFQGLLKKKIEPASILKKKLNFIKETPEDHLSEKQLIQLDRLKEEIKQKNKLSGELALEKYEELIKLKMVALKEHPFLKRKHLQELVIQCKELWTGVDLIEQEIQRTDDQIRIEELELSLNTLKNGFDEKKKSTLIAITEVFLEEEIEVDFQQIDLEEVMVDFDVSSERKDRLLSHLLARFGEQFTTDFHIKFNSLIDGENQEVVDQKLISLKSLFLRNIVNLNKNRSRGICFESLKSDHEIDIPLKLKVSLLLNIAHKSNERLVTSLKDSKMSVNKVSGSEILMEEESGQLPKHVRSADPHAKARFIVPSKEYFWYLFKFGLKESNYKIIAQENGYAIFFMPPTGEPATLLTKARDKEEAKRKVHGIIKHFQEVNTKNEGFHIVEHILLRPKENNKYYFYLRHEGVDKFRSLDMLPADQQRVEAMDTILLACFNSNYKIVENRKNTFLVIIKDRMGEELAKSLETFQSEAKAEAFIQKTISFYEQSKESGNLAQVFRLDDERKYHFTILNESNDALFKTLNAILTKEHEQIIETLKSVLLSSLSYVIEEVDDHFKVLVLDYQGNSILESVDKFPDRQKADHFVNHSLAYFDKVIGQFQFNSVIRLQGLETVSAEDLNYQLSVVYPNWTARFNDEEFFQLFKQTLFKSAPAHLAINMVGLRYNQMEEFEELYFQYMENSSKRDRESLQQQDLLTAELLEILLTNQTAD